MWLVIFYMQPSRIPMQHKSLYQRKGNLQDSETDFLGNDYIFF